MPQAYKLKFTAPDLAVAARWDDYYLDLDASGKKYVPTNCRTANSVAPGASFVAAISVDNIDGATVLLSAGNWPTTCARGIILELGGAFDEPERVRKDVPKYRLGTVLPPADLALTVSYDGYGTLNVFSGLTSLSFPLVAMSTSSFRQQFQLVVEPRSKVTATIKIAGVADVSVTGA